jgi:putative heme-binding domain-containing protein
MSHQGDPKSGETIFFEAQGIGCVKCHAANGRGTASVGPDLTGLALKYDKAELVRSVLEPSNRIATGYQPVLVATRDGKVVTGLVRSETDSYLELVDSETKVTRVAKSDIEERKVGDVSVMPAGLVDSLTLVEFADLISFLQTLKTAPVPPAVAPHSR